MEYLIRPLANPLREQVHRLNSVRILTRAMMERCIELLEDRWLCLGLVGD